MHFFLANHGLFLSSIDNRSCNVNMTAYAHKLTMKWPFYKLNEVLQQCFPRIQKHTVKSTLSVLKISNTSSCLSSFVNWLPNDESVLCTGYSSCSTIGSDVRFSLVATSVTVTKRIWLLFSMNHWKTRMEFTFHLTYKRPRGLDGPLRT